MQRHNDNNDDDDSDGGKQSRKREGQSASESAYPLVAPLAQVLAALGRRGGSPAVGGQVGCKGSADGEGHSAGGLIIRSMRFRAQVGESGPCELHGKGQAWWRQSLVS